MIKLFFKLNNLHILVCSVMIGFVFADPDDLDWNQSSVQAFYYFTSASINGVDLDDDDWIIAIHPENGLTLGARQWNGSNTDVPVMGTEMNMIGEDGFVFDCNVFGSVVYYKSNNEQLRNRVVWCLGYFDVNTNIPICRRCGF